MRGRGVPRTSVEHIASCARFELDADWTFSGEDFHAIVNGQVRLIDLPLHGFLADSGVQLWGSKDREYTFTAEKTGRDECMESVTAAGINTTNSNLGFTVTDLRLSYNIREELTADGRTITRIDPPKISMKFSPGHVYERLTYAHTGAGNCSDGSWTSEFNHYLNDMYSTLYEDDDDLVGGPYYVRDWSLSSTGAWASKTYDRSGLRSGLWPYSEQTSFKLHHTPAP